MPIISPIAGKTWRGRLLYAALFVVLAVGGVTMLYPFAIMCAGSLRSDMDQNDLDLVPDYLTKPDVLYAKFVETKYDGDIRYFGRAHQEFVFNFRNVTPPPQVSPQVLEDFESFYTETKFPRHWQSLGGITDTSKTIAPRNLRVLRDRLREEYKDDLQALSRDLGSSLALWNNILLGHVAWYDPRFDLVENPVTREYFRLFDEAPLAERLIVNLSGYFLELMILPTYGRFDTVKYNQAHATPLTTYSQFALPAQMPTTDAKLRDEWVDFVRNDLHPSFIALDGVNDDEFQKFLRNKYDDVVTLRQAWGHTTDMQTPHPSLVELAPASPRRRGEAFRWSDIKLPRNEWLSGSRRADYLAFVLQQPPERYRLVGPEFAWHDWLEKKYGTIEQLNAAHESSHPTFASIRLPLDQLEYRHTMQNESALRWEFVKRNYVNVVRDMVFQGRAFVNTAIVCGATVLLTLLINPLAAYAMSRFRLPGTYQILLFLMVTTAFPAMVVTVPKFLILRETHLLNGYGALILPFIANGYLIFLLKGFFDSLPRDLYEAAVIDGASETRMFFQITMALSKPILAVVALNAFTAAYTMFLYALIVCPDAEMWTINVWLYQWQQRSTQAGIFASLLVAALPTLVIFLFAQNIIMRGVVVPTEK